jgi:hypothetical protein
LVSQADDAGEVREPPQLHHQRRTLRFQGGAALPAGLVAASQYVA